VGIRRDSKSRGLYFFFGKEIKIKNLEQDIFCTPQNSIIVEFISDRMSSIVLRGRCCNITVLNALAPTEKKSDKANGSFYEELQLVFHHFPKYHTKILSGKNCV
jgi:hypothetical protein